MREIKPSLYLISFMLPHHMTENYRQHIWGMLNRSTLPSLTLFQRVYAAVCVCKSTLAAWCELRRTHSWAYRVHRQQTKWRVSHNSLQTLREYFSFPTSRDLHLQKKYSNLLISIMRNINSKVDVSLVFQKWGFEIKAKRPADWSLWGGICSNSIIVMIIYRYMEWIERHQAHRL